MSNSSFFQTKQDGRAVPSSSRGDRFDFLIEAVVILACFVSLGLVLAIGVKTLCSPVFYNSQWEGSQFISAVRLLEGQPIYPVHEISGVATVYPPVTPLLFIPLMALLGPTILAPKLAAFAAFLFCLAGVGRMSFLGCHSRYQALLAVGTFASLYFWSGFWYFNIRPDIFCCAFVIWGVLAAFRAEAGERNRFGFSILAALLFALAAYSKHSFFLFPLVYIAYCLFFHNLKTAVANFGVLALVSLAMYLGFNTGENHLFSVLFSMTTRMRYISFMNLIELIVVYMKSGLPLAVLGLLSFALLKGESRRFRLYQRWLLFFYFVSLAIALPTYLKAGGHTNAFLTFSAAVSITIPLALQRLSVLFSSQVPFVRLVMLSPLFFMAPFAYFNYHHLAVQIDEKEAFLTPLMKHLKEFPGKVYVPSHNYLAYLAGKGYEVDDGLAWGRGLAGAPTPADLIDKIEGKYFDQIIGFFFWQSWRKDLVSLRDKNYQRLEPSPINQDWPVWVPRRDDLESN